MNSEDQVTILLQLEKTATEQMMAIKSEEMLWLRVFLLVYGAVLAWSVQHWLVAQAVSSSERGLVRGVLVFSFLGTAVFCLHFLLTRWSYYGVFSRLVRVQDMLGLYDSSKWHGGQAPLDGVEQIDMVANLRSWWRITKPYSSFFTRVAYLLGSQFLLAVVSFLAFKKIDSKTSHWSLFLSALVIILLVGLLLYFDYRHFAKRS